MNPPPPPVAERVPLSAAERLSVAVMIACAALFVVMWAPTWFGFGGWLFLYPLFLLLWVPVEILLVVAVVLHVREGHHRDRFGVRTSTRSILLMTATLVLTVASLPVLWVGTSFTGAGT